MTKSFRFKISVLSASLACANFVYAAAETENDNQSRQPIQLEPIEVSPERERTGPETNYTVQSSSAATKLDLKLKETPQSITVFTEQLLQDQDIRELHEVLQNTPGISTMNYGIPGTGAYRMVARGFDIENFTIDGIPISLEVLGGTSGAAIQDTFMYEQIDIVRGSTGLATGFGNPTASINFTRKRPFTTPQGQMNLKYGSWNNLRQELDYSTPLNQDGTWRGRVAFANDDGEYWIDRASQNGFLLYGITELDWGNSMFTLGVSHQYKRFDELSPHGMDAYTIVSRNNGSTALEENWRNHYSFSDYGLPRDFNNATDWTYKWYRMTNTFAGWDYRFANGWSLHANYNYAYNKTDGKYGIFGMSGYAPEPYDMATYDAGRDGDETEVHNVDLHLKGHFQLLGREHDFVLGVDGYNTKKTTFDYGNSNHCSGLQYSSNPGETTNTWLERSVCAISLSEWNDGHVEEPTQLLGNQIMADYDNANFNKRRERGAYFSLRLRPLEPLQVIIGGRYSHLSYSNVYEKYYWKQDAWGFNVDNYLRLYGGTLVTQLLWGDPEPTGYVPYYGVTYELTPALNLFASYTGIMRTTHFTLIGGIMDNGDYLPPIEGNTVEAGLKGGFFKDRLNLGLSYFRMVQKNAPEPAANMRWGMNWPVALPNGQSSSIMQPGNGYKVFGVELNLAGEITPRWKINAGYVWQDKEFPTADPTDIPLEYFSNDWDTFTELRYNEFLLPKHQVKLFTSYDVTDKLTLGTGMTWQSTVRSYDKNSVYGLNTVNIYTPELEQRAYTVHSAMARYAVNEQMTLGLNAENLFDTVYYTNRNGSFYGPPRNITFTLNYKF